MEPVDQMDWRLVSRAFLVLILALLVTSVYAPATRDASAERMTAANTDVTVKVTPATVLEGVPVDITVTITNMGNDTLNGLKVDVYLVTDIAEAPCGNFTFTQPLGVGNAHDGKVTCKAGAPASYHVELAIEESTNSSNNYYYDGGTNLLTVEAPPADVTQGLGITGILAIVAVIIIVVVVVVVVVVVKRKKKVKEIDLFAAGPMAEAKAIHGKMPEDYYRERRARLAKLRPTGLTRDGRTIMGNPTLVDEGKTISAEEMLKPADEAKKICPNCNKEMEPGWRLCHNCSACRAIKEAMEVVQKATEKGGDVQQAQSLIKQADLSLLSCNYLEAETYATDAMSKAKSELKDIERAEAAAKGKEASETKQMDTVVQHEQESAVGPVSFMGKAVQEEGMPENCPGCGMSMQKGWKKCPACGEDIVAAADAYKLEQAKKAEEAEMAKNQCPECHDPLPPDGGPCRRCLVKRAVDNASNKIDELRAMIFGKCLTADDRVDVNEAFDLLEDAKGALEDKDYDDAISLSGETIELVEELLPDLKEVYGAPKGPTVTHSAPAIAAPPPPPPPPPPPSPPPAPPAEQYAAPPAAPSPPPMAPQPATCPNCGMGTQPNWAVCPACETSLREAAPAAPAPAPAAGFPCPGCGFQLKPNWKQCPVCGYVVQQQ